MVIANGEKRVSTMRLCDVLELFIDDGLRAKKHQEAMDDLWGSWGVCVGCHVTIALASSVLWDGSGFVHAGHMENGDAVPWSKVTLPGYGGSVASRLERKKKREKALKVA